MKRLLSVLALAPLLAACPQRDDPEPAPEESVMLAEIPYSADEITVSWIGIAERRLDRLA